MCAIALLYCFQLLHLFVFLQMGLQNNCCQYCNHRYLMAQQFLHFRQTVHLQFCDNVVIGAGAVVTKNITQSGIYAGNPAKFIKGL